MFNWATDNGYMKENPAARIRMKKPEGDGFHSWTDSEIAAFREYWALGTNQRTAFELLLGTAQRGGDVYNMRRSQLIRDAIRVTQEKTDTVLTIPLFPEVREALDHVPSDQEYFVVGQHGRPLGKQSFQHWFVAAAKKAGLPKGCSAHGLRKAAARRLAEAGATVHQIQAITGHKTLGEVERYTRAAGQEAMARDAMAALATLIQPRKIDVEQNDR
jgi:integrase